MQAHSFYLGIDDFVTFRDELTIKSGLNPGIAIEVFIL